MYERLIYFIIIILLAVGSIFGGISYYQQQQQIDNLELQAELQQDLFDQQKQNLDEQISDLQKDIDEMKDDEEVVDVYKNWKSWTHPVYGYKLRYPQAWTVAYDKGTDQNLGGEYDCLDLKSPDGHYVLHVGLRQKGDDKNIFCRTGVGEGETRPGETITINDQSIQIYELVSDNKIKEFFLTSLKEGSAYQEISGQYEITGYISDIIDSRDYEDFEFKKTVPEYQSAKKILESLKFSK